MADKSDDSENLGEKLNNGEDNGNVFHYGGMVRKRDLCSLECINSEAVASKTEHNNSKAPKLEAVTQASIFNKVPESVKDKEMTETTPGCCHSKKVAYSVQPKAEDINVTPTSIANVSSLEEGLTEILEDREFKHIKENLPPQVFLYPTKAGTPMKIIVKSSELTRQERFLEIKNIDCATIKSVTEPNIKAEEKVQTISSKTSENKSTKECSKIKISDPNSPKVVPPSTNQALKSKIEDYAKKENKLSKADAWSFPSHIPDWVSVKSMKDKTMQNNHPKEWSVKPGAVKSITNNSPVQEREHTRIIPSVSHPIKTDSARSAYSEKKSAVTEPSYVQNINNSIKEPFNYSASDPHWLLKSKKNTPKTEISTPQTGSKETEDTNKVVGFKSSLPMKPETFSQALTHSLKVDDLKKALKQTIRAEGLSQTLKQNVKVETLKPAVKNTLRAKGLGRALKKSLQLNELKAAYMESVNLRGLFWGLKESLKLGDLGRALRQTLRAKGLGKVLKSKLHEKLSKLIMKAKERRIKVVIPKPDVLKKGIEESLQVGKIKHFVKLNEHLEAYKNADVKIPAKSNIDTTAKQNDTVKTSAKFNIGTTAKQNDTVKTSANSNIDTTAKQNDTVKTSVKSNIDTTDKQNDTVKTSAKSNIDTTAKQNDTVKTFAKANIDTTAKQNDAVKTSANSNIDTTAKQNDTVKTSAKSNIDTTAKQNDLSQLKAKYVANNAENSNALKEKPVSDTEKTLKLTDSHANKDKSKESIPVITSQSKIDHGSNISNVRDKQETEKQNHNTPVSGEPKKTANCTLKGHKMMCNGTLPQHSLCKNYYRQHSRVHCLTNYCQQMRLHNVVKQSIYCSNYYKSTIKVACVLNYPSILRFYFENIPHTNSTSSNSACVLHRRFSTSETSRFVKELNNIIETYIIMFDSKKLPNCINGVNYYSSNSNLKDSTDNSKQGNNNSSDKKNKVPLESPDGNRKENKKTDGSSKTTAAKSRCDVCSRLPTLTPNVKIDLEKKVIQMTEKCAEDKSRIKQLEDKIKNLEREKKETESKAKTKITSLKEKESFKEENTAKISHANVSTPKDKSLEKTVDKKSSKVVKDSVASKSKCDICTKLPSLAPEIKVNLEEKLTHIEEMCAVDKVKIIELEAKIKELELQEKFTGTKTEGNVKIQDVKEKHSLEENVKMKVSQDTSPENKVIENTSRASKLIPKIDCTHVKGLTNIVKDSLEKGDIHPKKYVEEMPQKNHPLVSRECENLKRAANDNNKKVTHSNCVELCKKRLQEKSDHTNDKNQSSKNSQPFSKQSSSNGSGLSGFSKYFNSETTSGRANVAKATIAIVILGVLLMKLRRKNEDD